MDAQGGVLFGPLSIPQVGRPWSAPRTGYCGQIVPSVTCDELNEQFATKQLEHWDSAETPLQKLGVGGLVPFRVSLQISAQPPALISVVQAHVQSGAGMQLPAV